MYLRNFAKNRARQFCLALLSSEKTVVESPFIRLVVQH